VIDVQISGREMFEFNPELVEGDDDEADDVSYHQETRDDVRLFITPVTVSSKC